MYANLVKNLVLHWRYLTPGMFLKRHKKTAPHIMRGAAFTIQKNNIIQ